MDLLPELLVAKRATELGRHVLAAHHVTLQVVFQFERARAVLAHELRLHAALVLQVAGQRVFIFVAPPAFLRTRPFAMDQFGGDHHSICKNGHGDTGRLIVSNTFVTMGAWSGRKPSA